MFYVLGHISAICTHAKIVIDKFVVIMLAVSI